MGKYAMTRLDVLPLAKTLEHYREQYKLKLTNGDIETIAANLIKVMIEEYGKDAKTNNKEEPLKDEKMQG